MKKYGAWVGKPKRDLAQLLMESQDEFSSEVQFEYKPQNFNHDLETHLDQVLF